MLVNPRLSSLQLSWDAHEAPRESLNALSIPKIERFINQVNEGGRFTMDKSPLLALEKLKYLIDNRPTWAALLLFAENPLQYHIHIGRFKSPSIIIDDRQITDTLFEAVEQAMKFLVSYISVSFQFNGNLKRKERFAYPLQALREVLLNAVVHRDYANSSDIQIKVFDDRITIYSPGRLYGGLTLADLNTDTYQSHLRNKLIAEAFYLTKNIEKYGSGFIRIRKELKAYPEVKFVIEEISDGFLVTFLSSEGVSEGITEGIKGLFDYIKQNPGLRTPVLSNKLDVPDKTIERWLKRLKDEQKVVFRGSRKTGGCFSKEGGK
jgi:ATP-dependent DNA helicase RecG